MSIERCTTPSGYHSMGTDGDCEKCGISQDALDGAALRRLWDALPPDWRCSVVTRAKGRDSHNRYRVEAWQMRTAEYAADDGPWMAPESVGGVADTIAEAADKCREALG